MPLLALLLVLVLAPPAHAADRWRWPVRGDVLTPFHLAANRFAPGQHRGIDIAARAGAPVVSACPGRVHFAGTLPGRGRAVSVLCGELVATYLELGRTAVERGARVAAGDLVGTVAASHLQLGARRAADPNGYVDPLTLLRPDDPHPPPLGAAPRGRGRGARARARPTPRLVTPAAKGRKAAGARDSEARPRPAPSAVPDAAARRAAEHGVPLAAWLGLALLTAGLPVGAVVRRRRRARSLLLALDEGS
ncbi:MAG TPA: M23 family metallopeptidase [Solirubrobacteraceae bacterium]|jgi:hypothetical protein